MKRKKRLLSSVRLLIMSLLMVCFLPVVSNHSDSSTLLETSSERKQLITANDIKGIQEDALPITELAPSFSATVTSQNHTDTCQSYSITFKSGTPSGDFTLGYYGSEDDGLYLPLTAVFTVVTDDGDEIERESEISKSSSSSIPYQGLGDHFDPSVAISIDLFINPGESIVSGSLRFYNIFEIVRVGNAYLPSDQPYYIDSSMDYFGYSTAGSNNIDLTQYISASMDYVSTLGRYISFTFTIHNNTIPLYEQEMSGRVDYQQNQDYITAGTHQYLFTFSNMTSAFLLLAYEDDSMVSINFLDSYAQNYSFTVSEGDTVIHILIDDINLDGLTGVSLCSSRFQISIVSVENTAADINSSIYSTRFGSIYFDVENDDFSTIPEIHVLTILLTTFGIFSLLYIAGIIVAYFYFSNKYKNDEFRRVQPKKFFKINILGYLAVAVLLMDIMIIVYRVGYIASAIATFNPLDNYIVCLSIIGIIFIGYFAKYFYVAIKNYLERKSKKRLKLDNDVDDDGTN